MCSVESNLKEELSNVASQLNSDLCITIVHKTEAEEALSLLSDPNGLYAIIVHHPFASLLQSNNLPQHSICIVESDTNHEAQISKHFVRPLCKEQLLSIFPLTTPVKPRKNLQSRRMFGSPRLESLLDSDVLFWNYQHIQTSFQFQLPDSHPQIHCENFSSLCSRIESTKPKIVVLVHYELGSISSVSDLKSMFSQLHIVILVQSRDHISMIKKYVGANAKIINTRSSKCTNMLRKAIVQSRLLSSPKDASLSPKKSSRSTKSSFLHEMLKKDITEIKRDAHPSTQKRLSVDELLNISTRYTIPTSLTLSCPIPTREVTEKLSPTSHTPDHKLSLSRLQSKLSQSKVTEVNNRLRALISDT